MQDAKKWLLGALLVGMLGGATAVMYLADSRAVVAQEKGPGDQWRNHDGHWSYWHEGDHRWYYTDGVHWYYHDGARWVVYQFDKLFGRAGFFPGEYHPPAPAIKIELPFHDVFRHR
jgi:hypothetical protein